MSSKFFLNGELLCKKTSDLGLLKGIDEEKADYMMKKVHSDICGPHINGYLLVKKIMTIGYFWLTMEYDCVDFATKYIKYQMHGDVVCVPFT